VAIPILSNELIDAHAKVQQSTTFITNVIQQLEHQSPISPIIYTKALNWKLAKNLAGLTQTIAAFLLTTTNLPSSLANPISKTLQGLVVAGDLHQLSKSFLAPTYGITSFRNMSQTSPILPAASAKPLHHPDDDPAML
jgi:hypothetical protein